MVNRRYLSVFGTGRQLEQFSIPVPLQEYIKSFHEAISLVGIVAGDVLQVGAHEDQASGAALAFSGGDAGLSAPNLFLQVVALASLGILKLFFLRF